MTTSATVLPLAKVAGESYVSVGTELAYAANATISMNDAAVRTLAGAGGSGTIIEMNNLRNKSASAPSSAFSTSSSVSSRVGSGTTSAAITFNVDGTVTGAVVNNTHGGSGVSIAGNWFAPTGGTPGNSYWIKGTVTSGSGATYTGHASPVSLSVAREFKLATAVNALAQRNITIYIYSDAAGTVQVATGTIFLEVEDA